MSNWNQYIIDEPQSLFNCQGGLDNYKDLEYMDTRELLRYRREFL